MIISCIVNFILAHYIAFHCIVLLLYAYCIVVKSVRLSRIN